MIDKENKKTRTISFKAPPILAEALDAAARREYLSVSTVIRSLLINGLSEDIEELHKQKRAMVSANGDVHR